MNVRNILMSMTLAVLVACSAATPYTPTAAERGAMQARVTQFSSDFKNGRTSAVIDVVPPKVQASLAQRAGIPASELRKQVITQTRAAMKLVKIQSYKMDTNKAVFQQLPSGRTYALIPTQTVIRGPRGQVIQSNNTTLAFADAGNWYLVRIDEATQRDLLVQTYPEFSGLRVADGTTKVIG